MVIDVVTDRKANMHLELMRLLDLENGEGWAPPSGLYAVAYRTLTDDKQTRLQLWREALAPGAPLPSLPLWLAREYSVPLDLEVSYREACRSLRIRAPW